MKGYVYLLKVTIYCHKMCTKMKKYGKIKVNKMQCLLPKLYCLPSEMNMFTSETV